MTVFEVTQAAKLARVNRIAATLYRKLGLERRARIYDQAARIQEANIKGFAQMIEEFEKLVPRNINTK